MRAAILSDIHGNIVALKAVLEDLEQQGAFDLTLVPGDLFAFGPAPNEVFAALQRLPNTRCLSGNTDRYLIQRTYPTATGGDDWQQKLLLSFQWTANRLHEDAFNFLATLPAAQEIALDNGLLLAVHGSPRSDEEGITPATSPADLAQMPINAAATILVCGHTHVPMDRAIGPLRVVNAGSVGLPFDGDPRACYAIITAPSAGEPGSAAVEIRRVAYNVERAVEQFYVLEYPAADISAYNLRTGRPMGSSLIYPPEMRGKSAPGA